MTGWRSSRKPNTSNQVFSERVEFMLSGFCEKTDNKANHAVFQI